MVTVIILIITALISLQVAIKFVEMAREEDWNDKSNK